MLAQTGAAQRVEAQSGSGTSDPDDGVGEGTHSGYSEGTEDAVEEHWSPSCHPACHLHQGSSSTGTPQLQNLRSRKNRAHHVCAPQAPPSLLTGWVGAQRDPVPPSMAMPSLGWDTGTANTSGKVVSNQELQLGNIQLPKQFL